MTREDNSVDISDAQELKRLAESVRQTGKPLALKEGSQTIAVICPAPKHEGSAHTPHRRRRRGGVFRMDDPLWSIVGIAPGTGPENVSGNVDTYLVEAYRDEIR